MGVEEPEACALCLSSVKSIITIQFCGVTEKKSLLHKYDEMPFKDVMEHLSRSISV